MKFAGAFMVIAIHTTPLGEFNQNAAFIIKQVLSRIAVPFYFTCAGFFYARGRKRGEEKRFFTYLKRLGILYFGWSLLYLPFDLILPITYSDGRILPVMGQYLHKALFTGTHFHLWYLPALFFSIIILELSLRKGKLVFLLILSALFYFIGLTNDSYYGLIRSFPILTSLWHNYDTFFFTTRNGLFFGLIYTAMGGFLAERKDNRKWIKPGLLLSLFFFSLEAYLLSSFTTPLDYNMYLSLVPLTLFLFCWLKTRQSTLSCDASCRLRSWGMGVYFSHVLFLEFFNRVFGFYEGTGLFFLVSFFSLGFVVLVSYYRIPLLEKLIR